MGFLSPPHTPPLLWSVSPQREPAFQSSDGQKGEQMFVRCDEKHRVHVFSDVFRATLICIQKLKEIVVLLS